MLRVPLFYFMGCKMNKNKELTEKVYNVCNEWFKNFECPMGEWEKPCVQMPCYFLCRHIQITQESAKRYLESR